MIGHIKRMAILFFGIPFLIFVSPVAMLILFCLGICILTYIPFVLKNYVVSTSPYFTAEVREIAGRKFDDQWDEFFLYRRLAIGYCANAWHWFINLD